MNIRDPRAYNGLRQQRARQRSIGHIKRGAIIGMILVLLLAIAGVFSYLRPAPLVSAVATTSSPIPQTLQLTWPATGNAALGIVGQGVVAMHGNQSSSPTASLAKVMTALTVLKKYPLQPGQPGPSFIVTPEDLQHTYEYVAHGGVVVPVEVGQHVTEYQALQAMLLPSANNMADMLAVWAFGSMDQYHRAANDLAAHLGMKHSTFAGDASGMSAASVSTPADMIALGQAALGVPVLKEIMGQKETPFPIAGTIYNYNVLLGQYGITGIKTGSTDEAGGCYLFSADYPVPGGGLATVVGVIMGAANAHDALAGAPALLDSAKNGFATFTIARKGQAMASYALPWGGVVPVIAARDIVVPGWRTVSPRVKLDTQQLSVTMAAGMPVGSITASTAMGEAKATLLLADNPALPPARWRLLRR